MKNYNSSENIEGRCTNKFNEDFERGIGMSEEEWSQNMDLAEEKFFECMKIPWSLFENFFYFLPNLQNHDTYFKINS